MKSSIIFIESNTTGTGKLFVHRARKCGFQPILVTARPERHGWAKEEDVSIIHANTGCEKTLIKVCQELAASKKVAAIYSTSEYFIETAASLAYRFDLPGQNPSAVTVCRDKVQQIKQLSKNNVSVPEFAVAHDIEEAVAAACAIEFPVVLKPIGGSGSVGVRRCDTPEEVIYQAQTLLAMSSHEILIEGLIDGPQFSVESFIIDGESAFFTTRNYIGDAPHFVETGHDYPTDLSLEIRESIVDTALQALTVLGLQWGPAHTEIRWAIDGPVIIEVNPRLAGGMIPELIRYAQGIDLIEACIRLLVGQYPQMLKTSQDYASIRFFIPSCTGTLESIHGWDKMDALPQVVDTHLNVCPDDIIDFHGDYRDRVGYVICRASDPAACRESAESAVKSVQFSISQH